VNSQEQNTTGTGPPTRQQTRNWADDEMLDAQTTKISKRTKEELFKDSQSMVKGAITARKWLLDNKYIVEGEPTVISSMVMTLLHLASGQTTNVKEMVNGMRAVALHLEEIGKEVITEEVLRTMREQVNGMLEGAKEELENLKEGMRTIRKEAKEREEERIGERQQERNLGWNNLEELVE